ncbi:MAG: hypothetical protein KGH60_02140 [Candidatus Micrarchaeota archaeon]|nr:hypothetical protein [Candidatus Micrarchaeota archaeon]
MAAPTQRKSNRDRIPDVTPQKVVPTKIDPSIPNIFDKLRVASEQKKKQIKEQDGPKK